MPKKRIRALTAQQEAFCQHYTKHWNASRAAREAKYSEKTAGIQGYQQLQNTLIKERIAQLTEHALREAGITRERVLSELARIAMVDPAAAYGEDGKILPIRAMPEDVRRAVLKIETFEEYEGRGEMREHIGDTQKIEFGPKKAALDTLAKYLGMLPDKLEHSGPDGKPIETKAVGDMPNEQIEARIKELLEKRGPK